LNPISSAVETSAKRREPGFTGAASRTPKLVRLPVTVSPNFSGQLLASIRQL
jgi:hypothetical protein